MGKSTSTTERTLGGRSLWPLAALLPFLPSLWLLLVSPWPPIASESDPASLELYTLQATRGEALVGPYSRFDWNHPGPALFYAFAPLYAASGHRSASLYLSSLLLNIGAAACLLLLLRRLGGLVLSASVGLVLVGYLAAEGPAALADTWNPTVTVLPLGLLLALGAAALQRGGLFLAAVAGVGTFLVQSHVGYAPVVAAVVACVAVDAVRVAIREPSRRREVLRSIALAFGVTALLWAPPLLEELRGSPGNLSRLVRFFRAEKGEHTFAEVVVPLAEKLSKAPLGLATTVVPTTTDGRDSPASPADRVARRLARGCRPRAGAP